VFEKIGGEGNEEFRIEEEQDFYFNSDMQANQNSESSWQELQRRLLGEGG